MSDKYLLYIGKGKGTLIGVPARDLSYSEAKEFGIVNLLASGLYIHNSKESIPKELYKDLIIEKPKRKKSKKESE
jgi:hypothetical protein